MSLLNRPPALDNLYDSEGRLQGGLSALEDLARVIAIGAGTDEQSLIEDEADEMEPAQELPVSVASAEMSVLDYIDEDDDMSGSEGHSSGEDVMEEIDMTDSHQATPPPVSPREEDTVEHPPLIVPSSPNAASLPSPSEIASQGAALTRRLSASLTDSDRSSVRSRPASISSRRSLKRSVIELAGHMPIGDKLKQCFADAKVLPSLLVCAKLHCAQLPPDGGIRICFSNFPGIISCTALYMTSCTRYSLVVLTEVEIENSPFLCFEMGCFFIALLKHKNAMMQKGMSPSELYRDMEV